MFEPTIKYRRVNDPPKDIVKSLDELTVEDKKEPSSKTENVNKKPEVISTIDKEIEKQVDKSNKDDNTVKEIEETVSKAATTTTTTTESYSFSFEEEEEDSKIEVDPNNKERIIVTLSTGKQFSADRYCPHAGADLSYHGKVAEDDYPPEIGPVLMCPIHYWEFALEKGGRGGSGFTSINACPVEVAEKCAASEDKKKLDW